MIIPLVIGLAVGVGAGKAAQGYVLAQATAGTPISIGKSPISDVTVAIVVGAVVTGVVTGLAAKALG